MINDMQPHDEGKYTCVASNGIQAVSADTYVTVNVGGCDFENERLCGWIQVRYRESALANIAPSTGYSVRHLNNVRPPPKTPICLFHTVFSTPPRPLQSNLPHPQGIDNAP